MNPARNVPLDKSEVLRALEPNGVRRVWEFLLGRELAAFNSKGWSGNKCFFPGHPDRRPSCGVHQTGAFHCLGCNRKGSIFDAAMAIRGISFNEALAFVAELAGVPGNGTRPEAGPRRQEKKPEPGKKSLGKPIAVYDYTDAGGTLLYQVLRYEPEGEDKTFRQRRPDGKGGWTWNLDGTPRMLYRLPDLAEADEVIICEGEKDVNRIRALGFTATTSPEGAGKWHPEYSEHLTGKRVVLVPDNDPIGRKHMRQVGRSLVGQADVRWLDLPGLPEKGDFSDWLDTFENKDDAAERLSFMINGAAPFEPSTAEDEPGHEKAEPKKLTTETPRPLRREIPPPEAYPVDALGPILSGAAQSMHKIIQSPLALCCQSVLAAAALAVQPFGNIEVDGRFDPLSIYCLTVAASGERKSAADAAALRPHEAFQAELQRQNERLMFEFNSTLKAYEKSRDEALKKGKTFEQKRELLANLGPPPVAPPLPVLLLQEPTWEGLFKCMLIARPSIGLFNDEAATFLNGHAMNDDHRLKCAAGLSKLWDGRAPGRARAGDGVSALVNRRLSAHIMAQPKVAQGFMNDAALIDQGLLSRVLPAWPTSTAGSRPYKAVDLFSVPEMTVYYDCMESFLRKPLPTSDTDEKQLAPPALTLTPNAKVVWTEFHDLIETQLSDNEPLAVVRGFGSKTAQHALRLAGVLALVEGGKRIDTIDTMAMLRGIELAQFYLSEALRLYHIGTADPQLEQAQRLLDWLSERRNIDLPTIYQRGPNSIRDAKKARSLVDILVVHGWLAPVAGGMELDGKYRRDVWEVTHV